MGFVSFLQKARAFETTRCRQTSNRSPAIPLIAFRFDVYFSPFVLYVAIETRLNPPIQANVVTIDPNVASNITATSNYRIMTTQNYQDGQLITNC